MKALVLAGGEGSRLRPITYTAAKQLIPVANKPVLFYGLEAIAEANIKDVGMIVGHTERDIKEACKDGERWGIKITYIHQEAPLGLAHAVKIAQNYINKEPFVMYLGDNLIKKGIKSFVEAYLKNKPNCKILLAPVDNPQQFGVVELSPQNKIIRLTEKPKVPKSNLALVGVYLFDEHIFEAVNNIAPSWRNELEITDAIQYLIDNNYSVDFSVITGWWKDTGKPEDILEANRILLYDLKREIKGEVDKNSNIIGQVKIEKYAQIKDSTIRGPAIIGEEAKIYSSYVGPFTSIGAKVTLNCAEIEHSIIMEGTVISNVDGKIEDSLVGKNVKIEKSTMKPKAYRFLLGDTSHVGII